MLIDISKPKIMVNGIQQHYGVLYHCGNWYIKAKKKVKDLGEKQQLSQTTIQWVNPCFWHWDVYWRKTPRVGWCEEGDHLLASGGGFRCLMPASDLPTHTTRRAGVFLLYHTYLWNKQQVMSINLTTWSTMQYHMEVDHIVFYVIHSQGRYKQDIP